jgi:hypothetical protein
VIPADGKWFARISAAAVIANALYELDPQYPTVTSELRDELAGIKVELEAQAPKETSAS